MVLLGVSGCNLESFQWPYDSWNLQPANVGKRLEKSSFRQGASCHTLSTDQRAPDIVTRPRLLQHKTMSLCLSTCLGTRTRVKCERYILCGIHSLRYAKSIPHQHPMTWSLWWYLLTACTPKNGTEQEETSTNMDNKIHNNRIRCIHACKS